MRSLTSALLPTRTMGMLGVIRVRSLCHLATFLYEIREVRSNMMIAQFALMLA